MNRDHRAHDEIRKLDETVRKLEKKIQTRSYLGASTWDDTGEADLFTLGADAFMRLPKGYAIRTTGMDYLPLLLTMKVPRSKFGYPHQEFCQGAMAAAGIPRDQREAVWDAWMAALPPLPDKKTSAAEAEAAQEIEIQKAEQHLRDRLGLPPAVVSKTYPTLMGRIGNLLLALAIGFALWLAAAAGVWGLHNPRTPHGAMTGHFWDFMLFRTCPEFQRAEKQQ